MDKKLEDTGRESAPNMKNVFNNAITEGNLPLISVAQGVESHHKDGELIE